MLTATISMTIDRDGFHEWDEENSDAQDAYYRGEFEFLVIGAKVTVADPDVQYPDRIPMNGGYSIPAMTLTKQLYGCSGVHSDSGERHFQELFADTADEASVSVRQLFGKNVVIVLNNDVPNSEQWGYLD